jgi:hypothetical protein
VKKGDIVGLYGEYVLGGSMKCCENKGGFSAVCLRSQGGVVCGVNYVGSPKNTNVTS